MYGGEVTGTQGQISSPFFPNNYATNADYSWVITVPLSMYIQITFIAMDIEGSNTGTCEFDWIKVRPLMY